MKRLFTFLSRANNNSVGNSFNQPRVSSIYSMLTIVAVLLMVPSAMKGQTTTINFEDVGGSKQNYPSQTIVTMGADYSAISGGKVGDIIAYRNSTPSDGRGNNLTLDISRVAFNFNASAGNVYDSGAGYYIRREKINNVVIAGLYTGSWNNKIAVLNLKPGDKVKFYATASNEKIDGQSVAEYGVGIKYDREFSENVWAHVDGMDDGANLKFINADRYVNTSTINIDSPGDLMVVVNKGVYITSIEIVNGPRAEYDITTSSDGKTTTFEFTKDGSLDQNDYAIPYMSVSFGNRNDYMLVSGLKAEMHKIPSWSEDLEKNGVNFQPSAGNFYAFKPTSSGTISVTGQLIGSQIHVFVYDPSKGTVGDWVEKADGHFYRDTFTGDSFTFNVAKDKIYYICQDTPTESGNAFHLHSFSFTHSFHVEQLAKIVDLDTEVINGWIQLTKIEGAGGTDIKVKRCSSNINPSINTKIEHEYLYMSEPQFTSGTDNGGTVIFDVKTDGGDIVFVATFPYHAAFNDVENPDPYRTYGHTWNFIDPRHSDSNIGNCLIRDGISSFNTGTTTGILSIGQYKDNNSQFYYETENREWTYSQRQTGESGGFHDPYYANVFEMEGDNADMIWETEGLWFDTGTNLSCIYNEKNALVERVGNNPEGALIGVPTNFVNLQLLDDDGNPAKKTDNEGNIVDKYEDVDRYVGLLPVTDGKKSSFTIPGLKAGDRVLIFMKSGEGSGDNGIFLNITGAKDALGKQINSTDLYKAGGTNWQHERYEGCYHFIKDGDGNMTFDMKAGSMCKLLYIRIYTGQRIPTNNIVSSATGDSGRLLFMNDKGAESGSGSTMALRFRGKGQSSGNRVLTYSGNLNDNSFTGDNFKVSGTYNHQISFVSKVGEIGMFRLRMTDLEYNKKYVADFNDRNFTVGYRDKVDSYPYTWDFTDIKGFSSSKMTAEANNYPISAASSDAYGYEWDISLFDANGNMKVNTGFDPESSNQIFSPHKIGNGNQLWAGGDVIPEARGLWFYSEDDDEDNYSASYYSATYNDCLQITDNGIRFANTPDDAGKRVAWWNYKMVVPDVPANAAVYLRMKRDMSVTDDAKTYSELDGADVPFLATRFQFASQSGKTQLYTNNPVENGSGYSFYEIKNSDGEGTGEWIVAVKNTTGAASHLTFTLNGWIVKKVAVSVDPKQIGKTGYATESRGRAIDHELTSYLTGKPIKAYTASFATDGNSNVDYSTVMLSQFGKTESSAKILPTSTDGDMGGCILYHDGGTATEDGHTDRTVSILDGGFHEFVPDMHDKDVTSKVVSTSGNIMKSFEPITGAMSTDKFYVGAIDGSNTNLILSAKKYSYGTNGASVANTGYDVFFVRVDPDGNGGHGATLKQNSAYIQIPTTKMIPLSGSGSSGGNGGNLAKVSIVFADDFFTPNPGITTSIDDASHLNDNGQMINDKDAEWYNINGQKLTGKPTSGGLYIVNGKKVLVK